MNLQRALTLIPHDAFVYVTHSPRAYNGAWVVWADVEGEPFIVTQFAGPHRASGFVNAWYREVSVGRNLDSARASQ